MLGGRHQESLSGQPQRDISKVGWNCVDEYVQHHDRIGKCAISIGKEEAGAKQHSSICALRYRLCSRRLSDPDQSV